MYKFIDSLAEIIKLQLDIMEKRKALTPEEIKLIKDTAQPDTPIADMIPILQVMLDKEE